MKKESRVDGQRVSSPVFNFHPLQAEQGRAVSLNGQWSRKLKRGQRERERKREEERGRGWGVNVIKCPHNNFSLTNMFKWEEEDKHPKVRGRYDDSTCFHFSCAGFYFTSYKKSFFFFYKKVPSESFFFKH